MNELDINGEEPRLQGLVCEEIIAQQFWYGGKLDEPINVAHLKFGGSWFRLYFDHGIIFWRPGDKSEGDFNAWEIQAAYRLDDIGRRHELVGLTLRSIESEPTKRGSKVVLTFQGGRSVTFFNDDDHTDYNCY